VQSAFFALALADTLTELSATNASFVSANFIHRFERGDSANTLLLLHGTGGTENDLIPIGKSLAPSAALLSPRGQVLEHEMPRWFRRFAEGVFDIPDLIARSRDLAQFISDAAKQYGFDATRVIPVGYSNGANIAGSMLLLGLMKFPAAVLFRPMVPLVPEDEPDLSGTRVFIAAGRNDPLTSAVEIGKLIALLEGAGATVETQFENAGHNLTSRDIEAARLWLEQNIFTK
jgi:phospholipase/carboxylesterase